MRQLTFTDFAQLTHGQYVGPANLTVGAPSIDTRTLNPGDVFFALKGPRFDGHEFLQAAVNSGASALVVSADVESVRDLRDTQGVPVLSVECSELALQVLGRWYRQEFRGRVCAITGSCGKTTTKEMLYHSLSPHGKTLRTAGNLNNHLGVPLSLCRLSADDQFAVFELGMNALGEIAELTDWVKPHVGVITSIGAAHLEGVGSLSGVAQAKGELFEGVTESDVAVCPSDIPHLEYLQRVCKSAIKTVGSRESDLLRIVSLKQLPDGSDTVFHHQGTDYHLHLNLPGAHQVSNALCALATVAAFGLPLASSVEALATMEAPPLRGERYALPQDVFVTVDCYNANPLSMGAALQTLAAECPRRAVLILGDMMELGDESEDEHRRLGRTIVELFQEPIFLGVGPLMEFAVEEAARCELEGVRWYATVDALIDQLDHHTFEQQTILIKGSRGIRLEGVWETLRQRGARQ